MQLVFFPSTFNALCTYRKIRCDGYYSTFLKTFLELNKALMCVVLEFGSGIKESSDKPEHPYKIRSTVRSPANGHVLNAHSWIERCRHTTHKHYFYSKQNTVVTSTFSTVTHALHYFGLKETKYYTK